MNKVDYLSRLKKHLGRLPEAEQNEILRDQEELIRDAVSSGRNEQEFISSLGDPRGLASSLIAESRIQKLEASPNLNSAVQNSFPAVLALLALGPFNLIFVLGPFVAIVSCLFAFWAVVLTGQFISWAMVIVFFTEVITISVEPSVHLATIFMVLGVLGLFLFFTGIMVWISRVFIKLTVKYLKWNLELVRRAA